MQSTGSFLHIKKPLKSTVFHLARVAGFEPAHDGIRIRCLTAWRYPNDWRRHPDLNWGIKVLQTSALPLGYVAILARVAGFEPAHDGIRIRCLTAWRYPNDWRRHPDLNWGIKVLQTSALPLGYVAELYGVDSGIRTHAYRSHNPGS